MLTPFVDRRSLWQLSGTASTAVKVALLASGVAVAALTAFGSTTLRLQTVPGLGAMLGAFGLDYVFVSLTFSSVDLGVGAYLYILVGILIVVGCLYATPESDSFALPDKADAATGIEVTGSGQQELRGRPAVTLCDAGDDGEAVQIRCSTILRFKARLWSRPRFCRCCAEPANRRHVTRVGRVPHLRGLSCQRASRMR